LGFYCGEKSGVFAMRAVCLLFVCFQAICTGAETGGRNPDKKNEIVVAGSSRITGENMALARNMAITQALMRGVEDYLLSRLGVRGMADNFERIAREIIPKAREEVEIFHIVSECQINDTYNVLVRLRINEALMDRNMRDAGLLSFGDAGLRVLVMISETYNGDVSFWWKDPEIYTSLGVVEVALNNLLQQRGITPVDRTSGVSDVHAYTKLEALYLEDADIVRWGRLFSADVVIYGHARLEDQGKISLELVAVDVDRGNRIYKDYEIEETEKGIEGKKGIVRSTGRLMNRLAPRLVPALLGPGITGRNEIRSLEVELEGLRNFRQCRVFRDFLRSRIKGVRSVVQSRISRDSVSLSVEFEGERRLLLDRILRHPELPFPLAPAAAKGEEIILRIQ